MKKKHRLVSKPLGLRRATDLQFHYEHGDVGDVMKEGQRQPPGARCQSLGALPEGTELNWEGNGPTTAQNDRVGIC